MESRNELNDLIRQHYNVTQSRRTKGGTISLQIEEFNNFGIRSVAIGKSKTKGLCLSFVSSEAQANYLSDNVKITQGASRLNSWVWKYLNSTDEAIDLLKNILEFSNKYEELESEHHIEELEEEFNRIEIEKSALNDMTAINRAKYDGFGEVAKKINSNLGSIFHVDHATSIKEGRKEAIEYSNLQILVKGINSSKNDASWERFTYEQQCEHIISGAKIIPHADVDLINLLIKQLELYWDGIKYIITITTSTEFPDTLSTSSHLVQRFS